MAFTNTCVATSFDPQTTNALPLAPANSLAAIVMALLAALLFNFLVPGKVVPVIALYKFSKAIPCSDGLIGIRTSALVPVKLIPVSNWIWRDIFLFFKDSALR